MSVFDQTTGQETSEAPAAEATPTTESYVAKLVQERGEQWNDPEAIAKGKIEADAHIKNLEEQLAAMREDLGKQDYAKALLEQVQDKAGQSTDPNTGLSNKDNGGGKEQATPVSAPDIQSLVEEALQARDQKTLVEQNVARVDAAMTEKFGTDAAKVVADKAAALGMGIDRLQLIAQESPDAFMTLIGEAPLAAAPSAPRSVVNTSSDSFTNTTGKTKAQFDQMRRENPTQYWTPAVQKQLYALRDKMGDSFFNS